MSRAATPLAAFVVIALVLGACSGGGGSSSATPPQSDDVGEIEAATTATSAPGTTVGATPAVAPTTSTTGLPAHPPCAAPRPFTAGDTSETMQSGGETREYIVHVPPQYDGSRQVPLVLTLHGYGSNARQQLIYSQLAPKADAEGFIVVSPEGTGMPQHWNYPGLGGTDDIAFIRDLLDKLETDLCIDPKWVFATGMSNGAAFTANIACAMPERITAIAPVAATSYPANCPPGRPVSVISFRGTDDACVPFNGGTSQCGQKLPVQPAEEVVRKWAQRDGCNATPVKQDYAAHIRTIAYSECMDDAAVVLFIIDGSGHTWPGSIDVPRLGETTHEVNATEQIWQFFVAQGSLRR